MNPKGETCRINVIVVHHNEKTTEFCLLKKTPVFVPPVTWVAILLVAHYLLYVRRLGKMSLYGALCGPSFVRTVTSLLKSREKFKFCDTSLKMHTSTTNLLYFLVEEQTDLHIGTLFPSHLTSFSLQNKALESLTSPMCRNIIIENQNM